MNVGRLIRGHWREVGEAVTAPPREEVDGGSRGHRELQTCRPISRRCLARGLEVRFPGGHIPPAVELTAGSWRGCPIPMTIL